MELLEREAELSHLDGALRGAASGRGSVVLVHGDAGIGKTSLVRCFAEAHAADAEFLWGVCDDLLTPDAFGAVWDIAGSDPELLEALEDDDRRRVFRFVLGLLRRSRRPTVVVIEDAQWADEATLDLVSYAGRRILDCHGILIITCRDVALTGGRYLARVVRGLPRDQLRRIDLGPLTEKAVATLAGRSDRSISRLYEHTGGNPLFVTELLTHGDSSVPRSVRELIQGRVWSLSPQARDVLSVISVVPGRAERALVGMCLGADPPGLDECEADGLLEIDSTAVRFRHELVRRAVEATLSSPDRRRINQLVLDALTRMSAEPHRLVHHARWAGDTRAIIRYAPLAANRAAAVDSHREAVEFYRLLEPHLGALPIQRRAEILTAWARAEVTVGDPRAGVDRARSAVAVLREVGDVPALGRGLLQLSHAQWFASDPDGAAQSAAEATRVLERSHSTRERARAVSEQGFLATQACRFDEAIECADQAIALAETMDDRALLAHGLATKGAAIAAVRFPDGVDLLERSFTLARDHAFGFHALRASIELADVALGHRDLPLAEQVIGEGLAIAIDRERESLELDLRAQSAHLHLLAGRFDDARDALQFELRSVRSSSSPANHLWLLGRWQAVVGDEHASADLSRAQREAERTKEPQRILRAAIAGLEHAWLTGGPSPIPEEVARLLAISASVGQPWLTGELGLWLWRFGLIERPPAPCAEPYRLQIEGRWHAAAEVWKKLGMPYERAGALADGDVAAEMSAIDALDELGAAPMATRLRRDLRRQGVTRVPRRRGAHGDRRAGLTGRQHEVLTLLAEGLTNAAIADRLFISVRTAEHHVAAVLGSLAATSRTEAVEIAVARGIIETAVTAIARRPSRR